MAQGAAAGGRHSGTVAARWRARSLAAGTVVAIMIGAVGCSEDSPAPTPTTTSSSSSPTPTETSASPAPSPTPPPKPEAWTRNDDTGALAAAQYFMDLYAYANATGDLADWKAAGTPDCEFCSGTASDIESIYSQGGHIRGAVFSLTDPQVVGHSETLDVRTVQVMYKADAGDAVDSSGAVIRTYQAESGYLLLDLGFTGAGWLLAGAHAKSEPVNR